MEPIVSSKIRLARELLGLSQTQVAREIGIRQTGISAMEVGAYERISVKLLEFYSKNNVNINALFNPDVAPAEFRKVWIRKDFPALLPHEPEKAVQCQQCSVKDGLIASLNLQIEALYGTVAVLKERLGMGSAPTLS